MQKLIQIYLSRTDNSIDHAHIYQDPHKQNSKCDLSIKRLWTVDILRKDDDSSIAGTLCCSACLKHKYLERNTQHFSRTHGTDNYYLKHFKYLITNSILMVYDNDVLNKSQ